MDPALQEQLLPELDPAKEIEAIIRLKEKGIYPAGIRVIAEFGNIITCRVERQYITTVYKDAAVKSFKAARALQNDSFYLDNETERIHAVIEKNYPLPVTDSTDSTATGKDVFVAVLDWGGDFAHHDFINADGSSRFFALWDQGHPKNAQSPAPYGYGRMYSQKMINTALQTHTPYQTLGYHPGRTDSHAQGMHGTHVLGIATANGASGKKGVAPEARIIFVHLATEASSQGSNLGDSVRLLEAIDFAHKVAGDAPLVINLSVGRHGGSHDGKSLVEMGMDQFLLLNENRAICQSTGNYYNNQTHTAGIIYPGRTKTFSFTVAPKDTTDNELEIWYEGIDEFGITITHSANNITAACSIDNKKEIVFRGEIIGRVYHRSKEPNNGKNHIDIFLYKKAPPGIWDITLSGDRITDGRFNSWIERDSPAMQSKFIASQIVKTSSTGTICNGLFTIAVGAADTTAVPFQIAPFSSCGPTADGRYKPNILAPGVHIISSKSSGPAQAGGGRATVSMQGTSMASPYVTGATALLLQNINKPVNIHTLRRILLSSADDAIVAHIDTTRKGSGYIDIKNLLQKTDLYNTGQLVFESTEPEFKNYSAAITEAAVTEAQMTETEPLFSNECAA